MLIIKVILAGWLVFLIQLVMSDMQRQLDGRQSDIRQLQEAFNIIQDDIFEEFCRQINVSSIRSTALLFVRLYTQNILVFYQTMDGYLRCDKRSVLSGADGLRSPSLFWSFA